MSKPINITISPQIDTDPAITYLIRVEGGKDQIFDLLDHAEECGCESYEIVEYPAGVEIPASRHATEFPDNIAKNSCGCYNDPPCAGCAPKTYLPIDDVPTSFCDNCGTQDYSDKMHHHGSSPIDTASANKGESVTLCSECAGCAPKTYLQDNADVSAVPVDPDANRLHLFKVFTINEDTSETDGIFVMALTEDGAACLYHKARAREHGNILCEVVVSKVADSEVCDG